MKFGITMFATDQAIRPDELAREAEARGFESIWFPEHTHIPASRKSPWPGGPVLPEEYSHTYDLFVTAMCAAAATTTLKIGTGICLLIQHHPIIVAKAVASLDTLSNGRVIFGIGGGWNAEEMEDHGTDFKQRWKVLRERVEAMKVIWREDNAEYHGQFVNFDPLWSWPKPLQKPHPPIFLGGHGPAALERVAEYCDGWMPIPMRAGDLKAEISDLRARALARRRDPDALTVSTYLTPPDEGVLAAYADAGVHRAIFGVPPRTREEVLPLLDSYAELVRRV